tara:strand:- start:4565 stop:5230 length:666 start_codon:yes stop_codon:yes gene_type:complete
MNIEHVVDVALGEVKFCQDPQIVSVLGDIDLSLAKSFQKMLRKAVDSGQPIIPIVIHSFGGDVYVLNLMLEMMRQCPTPIATIVPSFAASAGCALFCAGSQRFMGEGARLMIHHISAHLGLSHVNDVANEADLMKELNEQMFVQMAEQSGYHRNPQFFVEKVNHSGKTDFYIDAYQALEWGMTHHVGIPKFSVMVGVNYTFEPPPKKLKKRKRTRAKKSGA